MVEAIFQRLRQLMGSMFDGLLARAEEREEQGDLAVLEIPLTLYAPFFVIEGGPGFSSYVPKLLSRMLLDASAEYQPRF